MIIFSHIPKTAGTTFKTILRNNYGSSHVEANKIKRAVYTQRDLEFAQRVFFRIRAISGHNLSDPVRNLEAGGAQMFTILRQPVMRCASHYQDNVLRQNYKMSFREWIRLEKNQNVMVKNIAGSDDLERAKTLLKDHYLFVGFTERFEESLKLLNLLLEEPLELQYRTSIVASSNQIKKDLLQDKESVELMETHNRLDQQLYDFAMHEIYLPAQEKNEERMKSIQVHPERVSMRCKVRHWSSVRFNNIVYRQLIKLLRK